METNDQNDDLRERAVKRLNAKRDFKSHLATYFGVNIVLVVIWALTGIDDFFWPVFPIVGWGIFGVIPHWWSVYGSKEMTESDIQSEMQKINREGGPGTGG